MATQPKVFDQAPHGTVVHGSTGQICQTGRPLIMVVVYAFKVPG